jgi:hypothetical protein
MQDKNPSYGLNEPSATLICQLLYYHANILPISGCLAGWHLICENVLAFAQSNPVLILYCLKPGLHIHVMPS